jgi:hypothetical protein
MTTLAMPSYQYQIIFTNVFDPLVVESSNAPDKNEPGFMTSVQAKVAEIINIHNKYQPTAKSISSFLTYNVTTYKITVNFS